jgi:DNA-binding beta-propeller fold protein YncE
MPLLRLTQVLQTALPHLSSDGRAILSALGCHNGHFSGPSELATWLGFHDRYQLTRALRREGLPPLEELSGWARTLYWMLEAETNGVSLRELAAREQLDPAVAYRLVRRVTGQRWSEVRRAGIHGALTQLRGRCVPRVALHARRPLAIAVGDGVSTRTSFAPSAPEARQGPRLRGIAAERVDIPGAPFDVVCGPGNCVLVTRPHAASIAVLTRGPMRVVQSIKVGPAPTRIAASRTSRWAYVSSQFAEALCIVDLERGEQVGTIPLQGHPLGAVMAPDGRTIYVSTNQDRVFAVSTTQRAVIGSAPIPMGMPQIAVHPSGRWVILPGWRTGSITEVDAQSLQVTRRFDVGGIPQEVTFTPDGQTLYATNESGWLDVIQFTVGRRVATVRFDAPAIGLVITPDGRDLAVGLLDGRVLLVDRQTLRERATIRVGGMPRLLTANHGGDGILAANEAGWVDVIR